jgi:uncharacterized protein with HEPN domain
MSILPNSIYNLLDYIYASSERILNKIHNINEEDFISCKFNEIQDIQDIVIRHFSIIGEASAKLLNKFPEFCSQHPEIPLQQARSMRNFIIHEYNDINWKHVWNTSTTQLVKLKENINTLRQEQSASVENSKANTAIDVSHKIKHRCHHS